MAHARAKTHLFFFNAAGRSLATSVWRRAVMAEAAEERGKAHVSAYWDLKKAFEIIDRSRLAQVAPLGGVPGCANNRPSGHPR